MTTIETIGTTTAPPTGPGTRRIGAVLALAMFAAQTPVFVLPPVLDRLAAELAVPIGVVGGLRGVAGLAAAGATVVLVVLARHLALRDVLAAGLALVTAGSLLAAAATGVGMLMTAHVVLGAGLAAVLTGAMAAAKAWAEEADTPRLLSAALMGPPMAAVLATLASGVLAAQWRLTWLVVPGATSALALVAVLHLPRAERSVRTEDESPLWRRPGGRAWAVGELFAYSGWSVVLVYSGALLARSYRTPAEVVGLVIGASAVAFMVGNRLARPRVAQARRLVVTGAVLLAIGGAVLGVVRSSVLVTAAVLGALGLVAGARSLAGSAFGLQLGGRGLAAMATRTTAQQLGYLLGATAGGAVLAVAGFDGLGVLVAAFFAVAAVAHLGTRTHR